MPPSYNQSADASKRANLKFQCLDEDGIVRPGEVLQKGQMYLSFFFFSFCFFFFFVFSFCFFFFFFPTTVNISQQVQSSKHN